MVGNKCEISMKERWKTMNKRTNNVNMILEGLHTLNESSTLAAKFVKEIFLTIRRAHLLDFMT